MQGIRNDDQSLSPVTLLVSLLFLSFPIPMFRNIFNLLVVHIWEFYIGLIRWLLQHFDRADNQELPRFIWEGDTPSHTFSCGPLCTLALETPL